MELTKRLVAEFVGTFALVFVGVGAVISSQAGGGPVAVALAHGLAIAVMVSAVGHISGGHFNPAITIGAWVTQRIKALDGLLYVIAQMVGGIVGAVLIKITLPKEIWSTSFLGTPQVLHGQQGEFLSSGEAILIEAVLTFFLVWVVFGTAMDPDGAFNKIAGLAIGFAVAMGMFMAAPLTGGAMNPARAFAPALIGGFWKDWLVFWIGPIAGAVIAALLYDTLMLRRKPAAVDEALGAVVEQPGLEHSHGSHDLGELPPEPPARG